MQLQTKGVKNHNWLFIRRAFSIFDQINEIIYAYVKVLLLFEMLTIL